MDGENKKRCESSQFIIGILSNEHWSCLFWVRFDHISFKLYNMISYPIFGGNFRNFSFWATSHPSQSWKIQRTPEGPEFRMPESRQHREDGGENQMTRKVTNFWVRWGLGVLANFFWKLSEPWCFFVFLSRFFFVLECSGFFWLGRRKQFWGGCLLKLS